MPPDPRSNVFGLEPAAIERIHAAVMRVALPRPVRANLSTLASRDYLCLYVMASGGVTGIGFSYVGTRGAERALAALSELVGPALQAIPANAADPAAVLTEAIKIQGRAGLEQNVVNAFDVALWDALAKRRDMALAACLGASARTVPADVSSGYHRSDDGLPELEAELRAWQELGVTRVKLTMRGTPAASEIERLRLRATLSATTGCCSSTCTMPSGNGRRRWPSPSAPGPSGRDGWRTRSSLRNSRPSPSSPGARYATSQPATFSRTRSPSVASRQRARPPSTRGEAPLCGGVKDWPALADELKGTGAAMSPCWFQHLHMRFAPAVSNGLSIEYVRGTNVLDFDLLNGEPSRVVNGEITLPDCLGFDRHSSPATPSRAPTCACPRGLSPTDQQGQPP